VDAPDREALWRAVVRAVSTLRSDMPVWVADQDASTWGKYAERA
jgi:hypothetical protein